ncbi:MBL fold metallo-hydrolase, partial [Pelagibacterales bacterium SAG-MED20]|nr:MBL fold metallo-hydrolase [Pelagibacterales bacterium SAG-MED20]
MKIEIIPCLQDNYSYLVIDEKKKTACVIDPSESGPIIKILEKNKIDLKFILNTHHHYDHVGGNQKLKEKYGANVLGYRGDKERIPEIDILLIDQYNYSLAICY